MENVPLSNRTSAPAWEVKLSSLHGNGLFARIQIAEGCSILEYTGEIVDQSKVHQKKGEPLYYLSIDSERVIDGNNADNPARFANHSCDPNCSFEEKDGQLYIVAEKDIAAGEEITVDYGWGMEGLLQQRCNCGAKECIGYIVSEPYRPEALRFLRRVRRR